MWLRVLLFIIIAVMIYRFFGGRVPILDKEEKDSQKEQEEIEKIESTSACAVCGTYVTEDDALIYQKKAYCSSECLERVK